ncbi:MAG: S8 family peptidase [Pirellulaceae bacterium]|nr:S8 family peptidase [Pirellulaceae bacterium]
MFKRLVEEQNWQTKISWFEPKPKFQTFHSVWHDFNVGELGEFHPPDESAPVVCVMDTGVTAGNPFLEPVTRDDLLHSFLRKAPENPFDEFGHGSGVASLVGYYAVNLEKGAANSANVWVAGARVLDENNELEDERLFSAVIREVVGMFVPKGVRIFVLAIGDAGKKWNPATKRTIPRKSWVARTLDHLSRQHDIVFVTCTGNLDRSSVRCFLDEGISYPEYLVDEDSRILDPGQAALALTVGSIAPGTLVVSSPGTAIASAHQPSPFTRSGPGIRNEIKPELVEYGGNLIRDASGDWVTENPGTNVVMASHQLSPAVCHDQGTSYAAPRAAYKLAQVLGDLEDLDVGSVSSALLKAFLVNSATYRGDNDALQHVQNRLDKQRQWLNVLGYGFPDHVRATYCDDYSTILYYQGEITPNDVAFFDVPIPDSLRDSGSTKRLTVTVVHTPEVQRWGLERYTGTDLKWRMFRGNVRQDDVIAAMATDEEATNENDPESDDIELPNELKFLHKINRRSRGVVQHDIHEWTQHREGYSDSYYTLAIAAYERWSRKNPANVPIAVVIRLEDLGRVAKVYADVSRILAELQIESEARQ